MTAPRERWLIPVTEYAGVTAYTGGIGRHYAALVPALARHGVDVDLLIFSDQTLITTTNAPGLTIHGIRIGGWVPRLLQLPLRALHVRRAFNAAPYDRVFAPEWNGVGSLLPRSAPLLTNLATSLRLAHEISGLRRRDLPWGSRLLVALQVLLEDRQIRRSAGLIAISRAMARRVGAASVTLPPMRVVANCVDVDHIIQASRSSRLPEGWPADGPVVLFLGRLERRKGVVDAVRAFADVSQRFPSARLVLAGASGDRRFEPSVDGLRDSLPLAARERMTWLGHVSGDELYRAISEATVVICPSRWEGFGNVALEVKSVGSTLVCTSGSGFDDFCTDEADCLMVPPADPGALANAVGRVLDDPRFGAELARAASAQVQRFAPDRIAAQLISAADNLLGPVRPQLEPLDVTP